MPSILATIGNLPNASLIMLRHLLKLTALGGLVLLFTACGKQEPDVAAEAASVEATPGPAPASAAAEAPAVPAAEPVFQTADQFASYGIGYNIGSGIARDGQIQADRDALMAGITDGLAQSKPRVSNADLQAASEEITQRIAAQAALSNEANLAAATAFLKENAQRKGVTVMPSGLQYEVITSSPDPAARKPTVEDVVEVHYHGTLIDGTVFDSSIQRGEPVSFPLGEVIPGWIEGLQLMSVGDKWKFYLPPAIAYGDRPAGLIPPNSALIFEVELISIAE